MDCVVQIGKAGSQAKDAIGQAGSQAQDTAKQVQAEAKQIPGAADELAQTQLQAADQVGLDWHLLQWTLCNELNAMCNAGDLFVCPDSKQAARSVLSDPVCLLCRSTRALRTCERRSALQRRLLLTELIPRLRSLPSRYILQCWHGPHIAFHFLLSANICCPSDYSYHTHGVARCTLSILQVQQQAVPKTQEATQQYLKDPAARAAEQVMRQPSGLSNVC